MFIDIYGQILHTSGIGERIENNDLILGVLMIDISDKIAPHKPSTSSD
jgi:hypothetical protein